MCTKCWNFFVGGREETFMKVLMYLWGTQWWSWLRHCTTSQKVAGLIPDGVTGIVH
jgi:hypothetical protein